MSRPPKGKTWNTDKHYGCRILKYPIGALLSDIAARQDQKFGNLCNLIVKDYLATIDNDFDYSPQTAAIMLDKVSADNPKINFTLYLTNAEHEKIHLLAKEMNISMNQLVVCFLREYAYTNT